MTRRELRWIVRLWSPYKGFLALILTLTFVSTMVLVSLPLVLKYMFDGLGTDLTERSLLAAVLLYLALGTLDWALVTTLIYLRGSMNYRFEAAARRQAYARLVHQGAGFFHRFRTGDLVTRLTDDVSEKLSWFICSGIFRAIAASAVVLFALVMMIRLDPLLTLFTVGLLPLLILVFIRTGTSLDRRFDAVQARISDLNGALEACFSGIRVVKAYAREGAAERSFAFYASECRRAEIEAAKSQTLIDSLFGHAWQMGVVAVLLAGGIGVMRGRLTLGTFVAFDAYVLMLIFPMFDIGTFFVRGRQSGVSINRLLELEEPPPEVVERPDAAAPTRPLQGDIEFESVSYTYPTPDPPGPEQDGARPPGIAAGVGSRSIGAHESLARLHHHAEQAGAGGAHPAAAGELSIVGNTHSSEVSEIEARTVLTDSRSVIARERVSTNDLEAGPLRPGLPVLSEISFETRPGEIVAVVGAVGAGKSTLLRLVPRLSDPASGRIRLDGIDLREMPLAALRAAIGYVPQEAFLFSGTIRENIRFGRAGISDEEIGRAADISRLGRDLAAFSEGLDTRVGVRGVTLSGGQRQRVALARALAGRPRVLVLDDVTAALDAETETSLWEELHRVLPDLVTIVVTHRTATLERAGRILVLEGGCVVEQGTHAHLSEKGREYRSIYRRHILQERVGMDGGLEGNPAE